MGEKTSAFSPGMQSGFRFAAFAEFSNFERMPLEPEDARHLEAAIGYLELGMPQEANEKLDDIIPDLRHLPEVLAVRVEVYGELKAWESMEVVAAKLAMWEPENVQWSVSLAYATRRAQSIEKAKAILLDALPRHPDEGLIHFNLACYECQLGNMDEARKRLSTAIKLHAGFKSMALSDPDLEPLWGSL